jgi:hypothetical protein
VFLFNPCWGSIRAWASIFRPIYTERAIANRSGKHETPINSLEEVMLAQALRVWTNLSFKSDVNFLSVCIFSLLGLALSVAQLEYAGADLSFLLFAG